MALRVNQQCLWPVIKRICSASERLLQSPNGPSTRDPNFEKAVLNTKLTDKYQVFARI